MAELTPSPRLGQPVIPKGLYAFLNSVCYLAKIMNCDHETPLQHVRMLLLSQSAYQLSVPLRVLSVSRSNPGRHPCPRGGPVVQLDVVSQELKGLLSCSIFLG